MTDDQTSLVPQCSLCGTVLSGPLSVVFRAAGIKRSPRNPNLCNRCNTHIEEGHLVDMTVLFADLSSFTELTQELGADRMHDVVDGFLRKASDVLVKHGAFIDKYVGDAVMALFNVPVRQADHARRAVAAASELRSELAPLHERFGLDLQAAAGIASGWARVGRVGSDDSKDYTAIGDVVNLAARLEARAGPGEIIVDHSTYEKIAADFPDISAERLALKGFRDPVTAYRLHASKRFAPLDDPGHPRTSQSMNWGAIIFGILGAPCAVTTMIGPLAVALGVGTLFGVSGALKFLDQAPVRLPILILAVLGALANLYTLWHARKLRLQAEGHGGLSVMTSLERRRTYLVLGSVVATLGIVLFEVVTHGILHGSAY
ncbi:MAG: adenylate/guanylate cyclase domain-containing protein [Deltaproteobacteria bacterium]|nr:adenylate/guanylate cyclase domain-containing protein [Deltaproteobacteria bacterium]MBI2364802.1 adenylate/guanylate cyclase domain-containing protein [Deltaproteobacteria bacterium]